MSSKHLKQLPGPSKVSAFREIESLGKEKEVSELVDFYRNQFVTQHK